MEGYGGPAQPSPTIEQALCAGYRFLEVKCNRCNHQGAVDLTRIRRHAKTEIWRLEPSLSCEECRKKHRWKARVHMIKLSREPESGIPWYAPGETDGH
jgi:ribosomal protein S27E